MGVARALGVRYFDAGLALVQASAANGVNGTFTATLPCLDVEVAKGICKPDQPIQVRASDGTHFCPQPNGLVCPVYCSGCYRFGHAMAQSLLSLHKLS
jgi:hypothetical protein